MSLSPYPERLTEMQAKRVYAVLAQHAGADSQDFKEFNFVHAFVSERPPREFRFIGNLGFGGKLRFPGLTVDTYADEETPAQAQIIRETNEALASLRQEFEASQA